MNLFNEIEKQFANAEDDAHIVIFGRCTLHNSPGVFCKIKNAGGTRTLAWAEGATCEEAMRLTMAKLNKPVWAMPGVPARMTR